MIPSKATNEKGQTTGDQSGTQSQRYWEMLRGSPSKETEIDFIEHRPDTLALVPANLETENSFLITLQAKSVKRQRKLLL